MECIIAHSILVGNLQKCVLIQIFIKSLFFLYLFLITFCYHLLMQNRDFIKLAKEEYKKIGYVECPAFLGERVYFTHKGFEHLLMKNGKYRAHQDQIRRLSQIPYIVSITSSTKEVYSYRKGHDIDFWSISGVVDNKLVIIVIRQNKGREKQFLSIMDKRLARNAKTP